jgi:hypothetical protein
MAGRATTEEVVNLRIAVAKARLKSIAATADARPGIATRATWAIRSHPWQGVGIALAAGVAFGLAKRRGMLPPLAPIAASLFANAAAAATRRLGRGH